jgi:hypothetical protein
MNNSSLPLKVFTKDQISIQPPISFLNLSHEADCLLECRLSYQVSDQIYGQAKLETFFNLKPEARGPQVGGEFQPDLDIQIEAILRPDLLHHLETCTTSEEALAYLQSLGQTNPNHPLLQTENWYALRVWQNQETGEVGYRTLWSYLNPAHLGTDNLSGEEISSAMFNFLGDSMGDIFDKDTIQEKLNQMSAPLDKWMDKTLAKDEQEIAEAIDQATDSFTSALEGLFDTLMPDSDDSESQDMSLLSAIIEFFTSEDWSFNKVKGESGLRLQYQGENGVWNCLAQVREEQNQLVFYSIAPISFPEAKRLPGAELLTRLNHNLWIGNFEMDFSTGGIRFKTSLDFADLEPDDSLIRQLVYTNVETMEKYLPKLQVMVEQSISATDLLQGVE